jgi:uncharacterized protein
MPTKNPLAEFIPIEEREDGVYCKVTPADKERLRVEDILSSLESSGVLNYNAAEIRLAFFNARGEFEKIGPPFDYYDPSIEAHLEITIAPEKAVLAVLSSARDAGLTITESRLTHFLTKKGVQYGVRPEQIGRLVSLVDVPVEVALWTPPQDGEDESIEYLFSIFPDLHPLIMADGRVNYREIKSFISVATGQVIARKTPATQGKPGMTVRGEEIPAKEGKSLDFRLGRNTELSPDGRLLKATKTGVICKEGPIIHVIELLDVRGDVDFTVGNVKYRGDVLVRGNVHPGFIIEAEGTVHVKGDVESAKIVSRGGYVQVERGIFGKNDTFIWAKKGITLSFAQEAALESEGALVFDKYLLHCECVCQSIQSKDHHGSIIGGHVSAEKCVHAGQSSADPDIKTKITLFDREKRSFDEKVRELETLEGKLTGEMESIQRRIRSKTAILKKYRDQVVPKQAEEVKGLIDAFNAAAVKAKYVRQKIEEVRLRIEQARAKDHDGFVKITGTAFPGTVLDLYERYFVVTNAMTNVHFKVNKTEIEYACGPS